ncbi:MAG TPA: GNAT family N-acetyltransferase [Bauldia sp.]|nr:GNAT family N-acetyltransferase [Bauldia sp.]
MNTIAAARIPDDLDEIRRLFREYAAFLGVDLCFQDFDTELAGLPGKYAPPAGALFLAADGATALGCVALRAFGESGDCEMKRMYVRPEGRGQALGRGLAEAVIAAACAAGYRRMLRDTLPKLTVALRLYASLGFRDIPAYYDNPIPGVRYLALDL